MLKFLPQNIDTETGVNIAWYFDQSFLNYSTIISESKTSITYMREESTKRLGKDIVEEIDRMHQRFFSGKPKRQQLQLFYNYCIEAGIYSFLTKIGRADEEMRYEGELAKGILRRTLTPEEAKEAKEMEKQVRDFYDALSEVTTKDSFGTSHSTNPRNDMELHIARLF
jgi:hypothetical protein